MTNVIYTLDPIKSLFLLCKTRMEVIDEVSK